MAQKMPHNSGSFERLDHFQIDQLPFSLPRRPDLQPQAAYWTNPQPMGGGFDISTTVLNTRPDFPIVHSPGPGIYAFLDREPYPPPIIAGTNLYYAVADGLLEPARDAITHVQCDRSHNSLFSAPDSVSVTNTITSPDLAYTNDLDTIGVLQRTGDAQKIDSHFVPAASQDGWNVAAWASGQTIHNNSRDYIYQREESVAPTEYYESQSESGTNNHDSVVNAEA